MQVLDALDLLRSATIEQKALIYDELFEYVITARVNGDLRFDNVIVTLAEFIAKENGGLH